MPTPEQERAADRQEIDSLSHENKILRRENEELLQHHQVQRETIDALKGRIEQARETLNPRDL